MSNVPLMFQPLVKYVDFEGRASRAEFWQWVLFTILVSIGLGGGLFFFLFHGMALGAGFPSVFFPHFFMFGPPVGLIHLALLLPTLAVSVRRLHDSNRTGWWLILPHVVSVVAITAFIAVNGARLIGAMTQGESMSESQVVVFLVQFFGGLFLFVILPVLLSQLLLFIFFVLDGTPRNNRFGPDPRGRGGPPPLDHSDVPEESY